MRQTTMLNDVIVLKTSEAIRIVKTLRMVDAVVGFENMDRLVGVVGALEKAINDARIPDQTKKMTEEE